MDTLPVYIVAGGQSKRYGSDKARALLSGVPMVCRVAEALKPIAQSVTAVAAMAGAYQDLGLRTIGDRHPGLGPLGGLDTAISDRVARDGEGWLLLTACDLAQPDVGMARTLIQHLSPGVQVVAFKGARWEPLFALYHSSIGATVRDQLSSGPSAMWRLIERVHHVAVPLPHGFTGIAQINTPQDHQYFSTDKD